MSRQSNPAQDLRTVVMKKRRARRQRSIRIEADGAGGNPGVGGCEDGAYPEIGVIMVATSTCVRFNLSRKHQEANMVAMNAREILSKENELLDDFIARANFYAQSNDGLMAEIAIGWAAGLDRHKQVNVKLINDTDAAFDEDVKEEIDLLEHLVHTIEKKGAVTDSWFDHLNDDLMFLRELVKVPAR